MSRNNTKKVTSLAQALGCLVINGFNVDYDVNEYGETISVKTERGYFQLPPFDYENILVADLVKMAKNTIQKRNNVGEPVELRTLSVTDTLNLF
jgi:hypothetical protein